MTAHPGSGLFAAQLQRAAAQRGRLDPLYQDLSDHWTRILQRLYPVWALIGRLEAHGGTAEAAERVAADYELPVDAVQAAIAFYRRHRAEVDARIAANSAEPDDPL